MFKIYVDLNFIYTERLIFAGHDISDGGLITCLLEMAFAGNCGLTVNIEGERDKVVESLFAEEVGWILEVHESNVESIMQSYLSSGASCHCIGQSGPTGCEAQVKIPCFKNVPLT